jgi:hypothetical protein
LHAREGLGRSVAANFLRASSCSSAVSARSKISAGFPSATACRSMSRAHSSLSRMAPLAVNVIW